MDTITHGIVGALISKAVFRGQDMFAAKPPNRARLVTWSLMVGAIFPDADVFRDIFSRDPLLIITWHRSITHSLFCMPVFAVLLAALTCWLARRRKWEAPSFAALTGIYAIGILSHIVLDLVTSFGTMIWSPLAWSRPAWDLIFIIDFTFTAILLLPQILAGVYRRPEGLKNRALVTWSVFALATVGIAALAKSVNAPTSAAAVVAILALLAALILLPVIRGGGLRVPYAAWNRGGLAAAVAYLSLALYAHHSAFVRMQKFAAALHLQVEALGALPLPPSLWHWDGLARTPRGVYELRMDVSDQLSVADASALLVLEHRYYPDALPNSYIEAAERLPEVQKVLWFARFPVTRFHKEGQDAVVEISDLRFPQVRRDRPASFTYRVRLDESGHVLSQGWLRE